MRSSSQLLVMELLRSGSFVCMYPSIPKYVDNGSGRLLARQKEEELQLDAFYSQQINKATAKVVFFNSMDH